MDIGIAQNRLSSEPLVLRPNMAGHFSCGRHGHFLAYYSICSREVRPNDVEAHA